MLPDDKNLDWENILPALEFAYNTRVHIATLCTPFFLTYKCDPRLPFFDVTLKRKLYGEDFATEKWSEIRNVFRIAEDNNEEALRKQKNYYDNHAKSRDFNIGDKVMITVEETKLGGNQKFMDK